LGRPARPALFVGPDFDPDPRHLNQLDADEYYLHVHDPVQHDIDQHIDDHSTGTLTGCARIIVEPNG